MLKFQKIVMFLFLTTVFVTPALVNGVNSPKQPIEGGASDDVPLPNQYGYVGDDVMGLINKALEWIFAFIAGLAVLFIVIGGIKYIISAGGDTEDAKNMIFNAIIGLIVALIGYAIVNIIKTYLTTP